MFILNKLWFEAFQFSLERPENGLINHVFDQNITLFFCMEKLIKERSFWKIYLNLKFIQL